MAHLLFFEWSGKDVSDLKITHWLEKKENRIEISIEDFTVIAVNLMKAGIIIGNENTSYDRDTESTELDISSSEKEINKYINNLIKQ